MHKLYYIIIINYFKNLKRMIKKNYIILFLYINIKKKFINLGEDGDGNRQFKPKKGVTIFEILIVNSIVDKR